MPAAPVLTRQRPPVVARALREARVARERRASVSARRAASSSRRRAAARRDPAQPSRAPEGMETMLALVGLGAERLGDLGNWAGDRSAALRAGADERWTSLGAAGAWPGLRSAARITLLEAPAWVFQAAVVVMGVALTGAAAVASAKAAVGPVAGSGLIAAVLPSLLAVLLAMAAVLLALHRLARSGEDQRPVWLLGLATLAFAIS